jgi:hypothetical protein
MGNCTQPVTNQEGLNSLPKDKEKQTLESKLKMMEDMQLLLKSGIFLEASLFTKVPIKDKYSLSFKIDYGRSQTKWSEDVNKEHNKSRPLSFEYMFGLRK